MATRGIIGDKMKKALFLLLLSSFLLSFCYLWSYYQDTQFAQLFLYDKSAINIVNENKLSDDKALQILTSLAKKQHVNIFKIIHRSQTAKNIYSLDPSFAGQIHLKSGSFPNTEISTFISNQVSDDRKQMGVFHFPNKSLNHKIMHIKNLKQLGGFEGLFHISTSNLSKLRQITHDINQQFGASKIIYLGAPKSFIRKVISFIKSEPATLFILLICLILYSFLFMHYFLHKSKLIGLLSLNGYSLLQTVIFIAKEIIRIFSTCFLLCLLSLVLYLAYLDLMHYFLKLLAYVFAAHIFILIYSIFMVIAFSTLQQHLYKIQDIINGKCPFRLVLSLHFILKCCFIFIIGISFSAVYSKHQLLKLQQSNNAIWQEAENKYFLRANFITKDLHQKRPLELKKRALYLDLVKKHNLHLFEPDNYDTLANGQALYAANTREGLDRYSADGLSIVANANYLRSASIKDALTGKLVADELIYADKTLNVLVPLNLRQYEAEIKRNWQQDFHFKKVQVANIYHKEFGESLDDTKAEELKVNIIYIHNGLKHFTYNKSIMSKEGNQITDPLILADTGNLDPSFYASWLGKHCYFNSQLSDPIQELLTTIKRHDLLASFNSAVSIYDIRAQELANLASEIKQLIILLVSLFIILFVIIILFNICYYDKAKKQIFLQRIHGFSFLEINKENIGLNLLATAIILFAMRLPWFGLIVCIIWEAIILIICSLYLGRRNLAQAIKEQ